MVVFRVSIPGLLKKQEKLSRRILYLLPDRFKNPLNSRHSWLFSVYCTTACYILFPKSYPLLIISRVLCKSNNWSAHGIVHLSLALFSLMIGATELQMSYWFLTVIFFSLANLPFFFLSRRTLFTSWWWKVYALGGWRKYSKRSSLWTFKKTLCRKARG